MDPIKILIVEDELIIAEDMKIMLNDLGYKVVEVAANYPDAIKCLESLTIDIVLSDISLGSSKDGVDLGNEIRSKYDLPLIFVTSHSDRSTLERAKAVKPNGYLVKPFNQKDLFSSVEIAIASYSGVTDQSEITNSESYGLVSKGSIFIKEGNLLVKVKLDTIIFMKSEGNYLEVHTTGKRHVIRMALKDFMEKLPPNQFLRIQKSHAVNTSKIDAVNHATLIAEGIELPIGRNFREILVKQLNTI